MDNIQGFTPRLIISVILVALTVIITLLFTIWYENTMGHGIITGVIIVIDSFVLFLNSCVEEFDWY